MAKRYGSTYSPDGTGKDAEKSALSDARPFDGKKPTHVGARSNLLFFAAIPLAWKAFSAEPVVMAGYLVALGCLMGAALLTREGLKAQEAYEARKVARRPAIPRKIFGSALTGIGLGLVGWFGWGPLETVLFAVLGVVLHSLAFGLDPLKNKGFDEVDLFQQDRVARAVDEAEAHLKSMRDALEQANDRQALSRLDKFISTARAMFRTVEDDPRDLTAARKYLGVYLLGAKDATVKYAELWTKTRNTQARDDWFALLDDLEANFDARHKALLLDDKTDLDIEIEVLRDRLAREGLLEKKT
ncbi:5-bromo-4-chloroindolyl phosphate hydrolysis family protein [Celeribacter litoreus]|uniref:5-bromo-4-chloroindolyl phosphate hydrolysis family protein n=1 Tax=Celeribacter litoreus TaxID=2876714 RepID=UPI001CCE0883|nr:5-bromo-4-chloroindolyl phosphate hydrolysis family protein [Celeribacter litoreus]MCA0042929.1 5-bromo-4-chloroindolyl phosphate hydrolysis family protein [Celeribacter litoreus]